MLNWEELVANAPKWSGTAGHSKTVYWGPDSGAVFGRYWDGTPLSEHPSEGEISQYYEFYVALANEEQKEVLQAIFDAQIATDFSKAVKGKSAYEVVNEAILWWDRHYRWEVKEFMQYLEWKKGTLRDPQGYDKTKAWKFKGSIPQRVKQLVTLANPELLQYKGQSESKFEKIFYSIFSKALIGGN